MEITKVEVRPLKDQGNLKAFCSVIFDDCFVVHGVRVIQGKRGLFVAMPCRQVSPDQFVDTAHPIRDDFRRKLEQAVLERYLSYIKDQEQAKQPPSPDALPLP
jgi:stage V sporulation protein G